MSIAQLKTFINAATKRAARDQIQHIISTAVGAQGDKKGIESTIKQLEKSIEAL